LTTQGLLAILNVMATAVERPLTGVTLLSFESRRAAEMAELIRRRGGTAISAPSMRELPLRENPAATELLHALERGEVDVVVLLTGVGTRALVAALADECPCERFAALLGGATIVARGPKPVAALREIGLAPRVTAPEPNTWREILASLDRQAPVRDRLVAVQEYGRSNPELIAGLAERGARVLRVPVYRWALPDDTAPLRDGVRRLIAGAVDVALFTSARQVEHLLQIAEALALREELLAAARRVVVASIGPVCSEALHAHGLPVDIEPEHPKMGHLVAAVARRGRECIAAKRNAAR
jgi:uroporphyrinogen-III synthase